MMDKIRFSSNYPKLHNQKTGKLVNVMLLPEKYGLTQELIEYDTKDIYGHYYQLPIGMMIHLTFIGDKLIPFCTIRKHTPEKMEYYESLLGKQFEIVLG